jgi:6-phosphofructokinase 1
MGRGAGDIALNTAIAGGATAVVVPEFPYSTEEICEKIKASKALGKRNFIVIVSEGVGSEYAPALAKTIQETTGVETKFARIAHIVRGGNPTLRDRVLASKMGVYAAEELLKGNSNLVVCERGGALVSCDIRYALVLDRMYKGTLKDGDLESFDPVEIASMKAIIDAKMARLSDLYEVGATINL